MKSERFRCAMNTLYLMLVHERWYEAKSIVFHEIDWESDPAPPGLTWFAIYSVLATICRDRTGKYR